MKKLLALVLAGAMAFSLTACTSSSNGGNKFTAGTYEGTAAGRNGDITVSVTLSETEITDVIVTAHQETEGIADPAIEQIPSAIVSAQSTQVDTVSGATITSQGIIDAANAALEAAGVDPASLTPKTAEAQEVSFEPGTYTGTAQGYNGPVELSVTFNETNITDIQVGDNLETAHVGTPAFDIMIPKIIEANGTGVDSVSGATFTSAAVKAAVEDAASQAGCDLTALRANKLSVTAGDPIEDTWDVVIVGGGGAGIMAAAQAAQDGNTVLVIEKNAEVGGNTLVSGGQYQSVMPYLVWDPENPDATTGEYNGQTYDKVKSDTGRIATLQTILEWSEEPFDGTIDADRPFVAGDISMLSGRGVHEEYLPTLQALKQEIQAYLDWAEPQLEAGVQENQLTLFSTVNLHIFQTYYGGLRPNAEQTEWVYGDYDLVSQFIEDGQEVKPWLESMGTTFDNSVQPTLIGALWQRENVHSGADVNGEHYDGNWGAYFVAPMTAMLEANEKNQVMLRTTANELITDDSGRVTGVKATMYDGTEVTANASKGVILATGGFAANIQEVLETNDYWSSEYLTEAIGTTNRSSLQGDGIERAQAVGAGVTGMEFTQLMPLGWVDGGNLAFGGGEDAIYLNPTTGVRYVDETSERDVLSEAAFENGIEMNGVKGVFVELSNPSTVIPGLTQYDGTEDVEGRMYVGDVEKLAGILADNGINITAEQLTEAITSYDNYIMGVSDEIDVPKAGYRNLIGPAEKNEDGTYDPSTYEVGEIRMRFMAPSTHHTMGGLTVDTERHVLNTDGNVIEGLYAAGEITGGIHGGNRLGGNAIVEIIVSGRTAAQAVQADNQ